MPHRYLIKRFRQWFIYRVLHVDDTPHRIALGVAVGIFITWTPTIGLQMLLCVLLSALVGANKFVGLPFVWLSNPLTVIPIYWPNFLLGNWILQGQANPESFTNAAKLAMTFQAEGNLAMRLIGRIQSWWSATNEILLPLWLGSLLIATLLGLCTYLIISRVVTAYRFRHTARRRIIIDP